ncbi:MAG: ParB N-terminal domain-containing protein [Spirochaetes bacterium]|nr:ParB N-terminal domain-containing protein [Spirochaetota bacterium]
MKVPIEDIIVKNRARKDLVDIDALAESFKRHGQISPIVISKKNVLIAGGRRLEAAKLLGWTTINVSVSECESEVEMLELEIEENVQRRDFTIEELAGATQRVHKLQNPGFFRRIWNAVARFFSRLFKGD